MNTIHQLSMKTKDQKNEEDMNETRNDTSSSTSSSTSTSTASPDDEDLSCSSLKTNSTSDGCLLSIDERLTRLESSIASLTLVYQTDVVELRHQLDSMISSTLSSTSSPPFFNLLHHNLNKNATPFVPSTSFNSTPTSNDLNNITTTPSSTNQVLLNTPTTTTSNLNNSSSQSDQILSLSNQVNLLSTTMSQLLSTLLSSSPSSPPPPPPFNLSFPPSSNHNNQHHHHPQHYPQHHLQHSLNLPKLRPSISQTLQQSPSTNPTTITTTTPSTSTSTSTSTPTTTSLQRSHTINTFSTITTSPLTRTPHHLNLNNNPRHPPHSNFTSSPVDHLQNHLFDHPPLASPLLALSPPTSSSQNDFNRSRTLPIPTLLPLLNPPPISPPSYEQSHHQPSLAPPNSLAGKWEQLGITGDVLRAIVRFGIGPPTKAQQKSIPLMLVGKDLVSQSNPIQERIQAYVIAALQLISYPSSPRTSSSATYPNHFLLNKPSPPPSPNQSVKVLVITATLDEASQAYRLANGITSLLPNALKVTHCSSEPPTLPAHPAVSQHPQPHLLIGTPSKLLDPVNGLRGYNFNEADFICVVLDEVDQLLARNMSDMVTSLMNFLPANQAPSSARQSPPLPPPSQAAEWSNSSLNLLHQRPLSTFSRSVTSPVCPTFNPLPSPLQASFPPISRDNLPLGRQTCIFSCTVPQDVLAFARTLNLRARVLVRRDEPPNPPSAHLSQQSTNNTQSSYDASDLRNPLPNSLPTLSGRTSPQELVKSFRQYYVSIIMAAGLNGSKGREWKLDALVELLEDLERAPEVGLGEFGQPFVLIYCNSVDSVESVSFKLASRGIDALALHQDMGPAARHAILTRFNKGPLIAAPIGQKESRIKALVVYDVLSKSLVDLQSYQSILPTARQTIVLNFELPRAVEDYVHRAACLIPNHRKPNQSDGVLINFVSVLSDVEMIKSIESFC